MDHNHDIELIEQLLQNELPEGERQALEERIQQQQDLSRELDRRQKAHQALDFIIAQNLKADLQSLEEESKLTVIRSRRRTLTYVLSAAASILLLIGAFTLVFQSETQPAELAAAYYELPEFSTRSDLAPADDSASQLSQGIAALENQNYSQVIRILVAIPEQDENYISARYYLGHAYYLSSSYDLAKESFKVVTSGNDIRFQEQAEWYTLLACLQQRASCGEYLERIVGNESHPFNQQTLKIQQHLK